MSKLLGNITVGLIYYGLALRDKLLSLLKLDPEKWDELRKAFDYNETPIEPQHTNAPPIAPLGLGIWTEMLRITGIIILVIILIVFIIRLILKTKAPQKSKGRETEINNPNGVMPTAMSPLELLWEHFERAKQAGDYRECIRILYQISLKKLAENGWVKAKHDKTNREYLSEIQTGAVATNFAHLTLIHEYSWYGDRPLSASEFKGYEPQFINFINDRALEK